MSLPLDVKKWQRQSHVTPKAYITYVQNKGYNTQLRSQRALFSWGKSYTEGWLNNNKIQSEGILSHKIFNLPKALVNPYMGVGAPAAGILLEEFIELGLTEVIGLGIAGALDPQLKPGDIVVCKEALRDEGTSYHYLPEEPKVVTPNLELIKEIESILSKENIPYTLGGTWTTDAPYRETKEEVLAYRERGIKTVEMEAAAIYAIAQVRKVKVASVFIVSDVFDAEVWEPHFHHKIIKQSYLKLLKALATHWGGFS